MQFSSSNYTVQEDCTTVTITLNRIGDASGTASVDYATSDVTATERKDYITALGKLVFAPGETSKSFAVLINEDSYVEGNETFDINLSNPSGSTLGAPAVAVVTIIDDPSEPATNPIDDPQNYVCQHYHDFLNRQPDAAGLAFWTNEISSCGTDAQCIEIKRINVSGAFYLSIEFQQTGYLVERLYKTAFGSASGASTFGGSHQLPVPDVRLNEFLSDTQKIGQGVVVGQANWEQILENNKQAFTADFVQRLRFNLAFPTAMTAAQFVDTLNGNAGNPLSQTERGQLITDLSDGAKSRAQILRAIAEHPNLVNAEFNRAFVLMQYFGYLRRNPNDPPDSDYTGYDFWLTKLNQFNGNYIDAEMVKAFITSAEYRTRFAPASPPPSPTPTPIPGQTLTSAQRITALNKVKAKFASLDGTSDRDAANQQLVDFIRSLPEFAEAGISTDSCVWATYTDGVELIVVNNDPSPGQAGAVEPATAALTSPIVPPANLSNSIQARLVNAHGPSFANPIPDIRSWLNDQNYTEPVNDEATVQALKTVGDDGVFFFRGHGGNAKGTQPYSLETVTEVSEQNDETFKDDLAPQIIDGEERVRLRYMLSTYDLNLTGDASKKETYAITSQFVRDYWRNFSANSFVFIDACDSAAAEAAGFQNAIKQKQASVYAGWTGRVNQSVGFNTSKFVFDRLLGANHVYPESDGFKQRPFDYNSVANDFQYHGVGMDPATRSNLVFQKLSGSQSDGFQALAPSIEELNVDETTNTLAIIGIFGEDPGEIHRSVSVGGHNVNVKTGGWHSIAIFCDLPTLGLGSAGEVIVMVTGHKSNAACLSEWRGTFTHTLLSNGTLKQTVTYNVHLRADIRNVRYNIHQPPTIEHLRLLMAALDSIANYDCSGLYLYPNGSESWSGSGVLLSLAFSPGPDFFNISGSLTNSSGLLLTFDAAAEGRIVTTTSSGATTTTNEGLISPEVPTSDISVLLDANGNIIGNTLTGKDEDGTHTLTWNQMSNQYPPNPNSPR